ncbi:hypothetical protein EC968_002962 [Mortierella alpina]|nr:hypothetical protein EC968_002962 [Mortierella alpina]
MEAFITLLTNNSYASGALVLAHSLRAAHTSKQLAILITASVSRAIRGRLATVYDAVIEIGEIDSNSTSNLQLLGRPELGITLTKIHVFNQTQYSKVVFLDADTLVLRNIDELFDTAANGALDDPDRNKRFAAAPDAGWPDCFNSGVFVCRPSYADYTGLIEMASQQGTFDGGDQGLLNSYFSGWSRGDSSNRLPFVYNTTPSSVYSYAPAFQQYKDKLAVIHFVGSFKPWQWLRFADGTVFPRNTSSADSITLVQQWWHVFDQYVGGKVDGQQRRGEYRGWWSSGASMCTKFSATHFVSAPSAESLPVAREVAYLAIAALEVREPSDIHEVSHGYDLPPISQWDHVGLDGQPKEPEIERKPHYEGWFQAYDHQNQRQPAPVVHAHDAGGAVHQERQHPHHEHHADQEQHQDHQDPATVPSHGHDQHDTEQHHKPAEQWRPPIPPRLADRIDWHHQHHHQHQDSHEHHKHHHHEHHEHHEHKEQQGHHHHHVDPQYAHNPHHLTDYHYQPPPPPPKVPDLPEPDFHRYEPNAVVNGTDERQTHHHTSSSHSSADREINPHHLTDYRYRLPSTVDSPDIAAGAATFAAIIPEPVGLPDMYYPNAWDLPEDPRKAHPAIEPVPLLIEDTTNDDNTSIPSGKGRPIFPWESSGPSTPNKSPRTPTRTYYNYSAGAEELKRKKELEISRRLEFEEAALERIRMEEYSRYERDRMKEEAQERVSGSQAFENFRLVNAWDVDLGVQMSMLQKTEKRRPRSRKSSAGGIRKGYGLEDMYAYEARQRQEQYEAELVRKRREEEERWQKEQEEARIKEEEIRLEKQRLAKLARIRAQKRQREEEESSKYVFRNAWDPPNATTTKKKLRIEDEEVEMALPLRHNRRSMLGGSYSSPASNGAGASGDGSVKITTAARAGRAIPSVSGEGTSVSGGRSGWSQRTTSVVSDDTRVDQEQHKTRSEAIRSGQDTKVTEQRLAAAAQVAEATAGAVSLAGAGALLASHGAATRETSTTTANQSEAAFSSTTKITAPGSHRFVRTTVTTTITRRKFQNGAVVSSSTDTSTTGGEIMFEIPAGPRSGSYFGKPGRRTVTVRSSEEASRLAGHAESTESRTATSTNTQRTITSRQSTESTTTHREGSEEAHSSRQITRVDTPPGVRKVGERTTTTTTTRSVSKESGATSQSQTISSEVISSGSTSSTKVAMSEGKKALSAALQIDTTSPAREHSDEEDEDEATTAEERQKRTDLREKEASAVAVAKAKEVLSKYPQATSRYATTKQAAGGSTSISSGQKTTGEAWLYANDPNLPSSSATSVGKGKELKVHTVRTSGSQVEDDHIYQDEDLEELEYFGERHTRAGLPLGSPYMPSTPLGSVSHRYSASASGFSSRAGSRPTTPGPSTPSRFGPGTPKGMTKRAFELKKDALVGGGSMLANKQQEQRQTAQIDTGFSNYKIEWNWKELLGKKPRHWSAEEGEEYYDPYNALSTHGSLIDSDEDDGRILDSSSDSEEEEVEARLRQGKARGEGSSGSGSGNSAAAGGFAAGEDNEFTRDSGFVIRGGKIARRRSSMALDRREL